jgi:hypothetical protein
MLLASVLAAESMLSFSANSIIATFAAESPAS